MLPDMSGLDVLERLRTHPTLRHVPVMLVSGLAQQLTDDTHGADVVLAKPFDIAVLVEPVEALTGASWDGVG